MSLLTFVAFYCLANSTRIDRYDLQKVVECQDIQMNKKFWNNKYIAMALFFLDCIKTHTYYRINSKNVSYFSLIRVFIKHQLQPKSRSFKVTLLAFRWAFAWWPPQGECFGVDMTRCHMASKQLILRKNPILPQTNARWWLKQATTLLMGTSLPSMKTEWLQRSLLCTEQSIKMVGVRVWHSLEMECKMVEMTEVI